MAPKPDTKKAEEVDSKKHVCLLLLMRTFCYKTFFQDQKHISKLAMQKHFSSTFFTGLIR